METILALVTLAAFGALLVGLFRPGAVRQHSRRGVLKIYGAALVMCLLLIGIIAAPGGQPAEGPPVGVSELPSSEPDPPPAPEDGSDAGRRLQPSERTDSRAVALAAKCDETAVQIQRMADYTAREMGLQVGVVLDGWTRAVRGIPRELTGESCADEFAAWRVLYERSGRE